MKQLVCANLSRFSRPSRLQKFQLKNYVGSIPRTAPIRKS
ncbi:hypothetical protein NC653_032068 [Populus alba x Populus x berolinensis]|uniref:Uncharacterized protein n=1 Tax=Populus alba x Populus x berolinensis TaxID=444605 RepID=A0AAD6PXS0_9ROSI|nr:hypothetical protein NC653_032068 [Populus alba x Populus x berolinensis]